MASSQVPKSESKQTGAKIVVTNQTPTGMTISRSNIWAGTATFPRNLQPNVPATITHTGAVAPENKKKAGDEDDTGAVAVVIYSGPNPQRIPCSWVLAWDAPVDPALTPNKVYVATGPANLIANMSFPELRQLLTGGTGNADAADEVYRTEAVASISVDEATPAVPNVAASFSLI